MSRTNESWLPLHSPVAMSLWKPGSSPAMTPVRIVLVRMIRSHVLSTSLGGFCAAADDAVAAVARRPRPALKLRRFTGIETSCVCTRMALKAGQLCRRKGMRERRSPGSVGILGCPMPGRSYRPAQWATIDCNSRNPRPVHHVPGWCVETVQAMSREKDGAVSPQPSAIPSLHITRAATRPSAQIRQASPSAVRAGQNANRRTPESVPGNERRASA